MKHPYPMQPIRLDDDGVSRFEANPLVRALLDFATPRGMGMNELYCVPCERRHREQFAQLIGYSIDGYSELSYVSDASYNRAVAASPRKASRRKSGGTKGE